ncbi:MAG: response regulator [Treponema sp.]|nr:response regulator [Treponema sp.]
MRKGSELFERKVLIVDDEEINRQILGNIIESEDKVDIAKDGKEALEKIHDRSSGISLVMLDLLMPQVRLFFFMNPLYRRLLPVFDEDSAVAEGVLASFMFFCKL